MPSDDLTPAASRYERTADEFQAAVDHLRTAAKHLRNQEVPRGCAHALAAHGHVVGARAMFDKNAILHASKSIS
jgi:hypothetical protein